MNEKETGKMKQNVIQSIREQLFAMQDIQYRDFQSKLIPTVPFENVIGVRTPQLRKFAREQAKMQEIQEFLQDVPHQYYEENNLHAFLIEQIKDYTACVQAVDVFLPYVDNWATCDMMSPKIFKKHKKELLVYIEKWMASGETYTIRYGIGMIMTHFLEEDFDVKYLDAIVAVQSEEYYVNMMRAWCFATALAKQYEQTVRYIDEARLDTWTHNKTIQKAVESNRITLEQKAYLKQKKIK